MTEQKDRELVKLSERIFDLFKNRTDGANRGIDDIHWRNIREFALQKKMAENEVVEAFRRLEKLDLIMPSPSQSAGYYRLTSKGQAEDVAHLTEIRLKDAYSRAARRENLKPVFRFLFLAFSALLVLLLVLTQGLKLQLDPGYLPILGILWVVSMGGALTPLQPHERTIFCKLYASYLLLKKGIFEGAEKDAREAVESLRYSDFSRSEWVIVSSDVRLLTRDLGRRMWRTILPAIRRKDPKVTQKLISLADVFANPSLELLRSEVTETVADLKEEDYEPAGRIDGLAASLGVYRAAHVLLVLGVAVVMDVIVFAVLSLAENKPLSAYYLYMAAGYIPGILAAIGLRSMVVSPKR